MARRFIIEEDSRSPRQPAWKVFLLDTEKVGPPRWVALVFDKTTVEMLSEAPALIQQRDVLKRYSDNAGMVNRKREYNDSIFGRMQSAMHQYFKKL
jgi:hypothetical protein